LFWQTKMASFLFSWGGTLSLIYERSATSYYGPFTVFAKEDRKAKEQKVPPGN